MRLSQDVEITLSVALSEAARLGHEYAGVEHLLLALAIDDDTARVLRHAGAPVETLRAGLEAWLAQEVPSAGAAGGEEVPREPRLSLALQRTLARAAAQVEASGREEVAGRDLLVALFAETGSAAVALLAEHGVSRLDVVRYIAHGVSRLEPSIPGAAPPPAGGGGPG
ncbi:MAG TPA: Clp protease N-terminal domain-containing protein, partial [Thermoanaerobaculia bacterium]|nr:Clp protease N-terminal domain-containing protein [Thermoanaerobaculia bacterium]